MAARVLSLFADGLRNAITGAGTSRDPRTANGYAWRALTQQEVIAAFRGSGLMRKIINIPALDMVREWRDWKAEADQITEIEAEEKRLNLRAKVRTAEVLRGLGGGALVLGLPDKPWEPAPTAIAKGSLAYIHVISRWHLSFDALQDDARLPGYGEPRMWKMNSASGQVGLHPSRVVAFPADTGATLATYGIADAQDAFWGESKVAQVLDAVTDCDAARASFAALLHKARLTRIGIPNLSELVSLPGGQAKVQARLEMIALAESLHNAAVYDTGPGNGEAGEKIDDVEYNFAGAKDVLNAYAEFAAAISDIPATRLLGRAPEGMNASGDSQQKDWNKMVAARQELELDPCLERVDGYLIASALGVRPPEVWSDWAPLDLPTDKETAERFKTQMEAVEKLGNLAAMPDRAFNRGVQSLMIEEGYLPELETALSEIPEEERYGIEPESGAEEIDEPTEGGDPDDPAGEGEQPDQEPPRRAANDAQPIPLYVRRDLLNAAELIEWAKAQGFTSTLPASDMHVTVLFSRTAVDPIKMGETWSSDDKGRLRVKPGGPRAIERLGENAVVLLFASSDLVWRHRGMIEAGASHDFDEYQPHVTISYEAPAGLDLEAIKPFAGELLFGPEIFEPLDPDWEAKITEEA
jgi:uncharacterized protein